MQIRIENLTYWYRSPFFPEHRALYRVNLEIRPREIVAIVGGTGSGKTTLIQHLNGLLKPTEGTVTIDSRDLAKSGLEDIRKRVGLVFQFPENQLFEETVYKDVSFGPRNMKQESVSIQERVQNAMKLVGLDFEQFMDVSPFNLSGGEQRCVAIAGVLAMEPELLVFDDPTVGLDRNGALKVEMIIQSYHRQGKTVVFVSHDMDLVARLAERILVIHQGEILYDGSKEKLFQEENILKKAGLALPQIPRFFLGLKEKGHPVRTDLFTRGEALQEMRRVFGKDAGKN
jgi:energy-coupling factor transport system ATP-binding protein